MSIMRVFKTKPTFISVPTLPLQSNTSLKTTLKSFLIDFPVLLFGFGFFSPLNFRTLPVGSKSWVLLQRSTFCFLSAGDSLLRMLPCLGHRKAKYPHPEPTGAAWALTQTSPSSACSPEIQIKAQASSCLKKFIRRLNSKGETISLAISGSGSKAPGTVLETSTIGNSKCTLFITQHQPIFYLKSQINLMEKNPPEILTLPANVKYFSRAKWKI